MNRATGRLSGDLSLTNPRDWVPIVIGGSLVAYGLSRRSVGGLLVAGAGGAFALQSVSSAGVTRTRRQTRGSILGELRTGGGLPFLATFREPVAVHALP
jgi:hypothetical protein